MLTCQRASFSIPRDEHYLNCAYMSPLPLVVEQAGIAGIRRKRRPSLLSPSDFFTEADRARALFGTLVGAPAERIAIIPAVSYGLALVARNIPLSPGRSVVMAHEQFPSNVHVWRSICRERGGEVRVIEPPDGERRGAGWSERLLEAIDRSTAVVTLPHVHWTDGTRFDLEAIGARARAVGAALVVDGTQSIGALPFDSARLRPDALVTTAYKWMMGPYSIGLAYLGPRFDSAAPLEETWIGRAGSENFSGLVNYRDDYQPGAARFDVGERSNFALLPMLNAAMELLLEWRVEAIQEYCRAITRPLLERLRHAGYTVEDEAWRGAHLFGLRPPGVELPEIQRRLEERKVFVSLRGSSLRISPNVYNDEADLTALEESLLG